MAITTNYKTLIDSTAYDLGSIYHPFESAQCAAMLTWGSNSSGSLGNGEGYSAGDRSAPAYTISPTRNNWMSVGVGENFTTFVRRDGTLWSCGNATQGQLGNGITSFTGNRSSPTQIGSLTNWKQVSSGNVSSAAVKTDGTMWTWGVNSLYQLGDGTNTNRNSPVQISGTGWSNVAVGDGTVYALKSDGTMWVWGDNTSGCLGIGTTTAVSTPVAMPGSTTWSSITIGTTVGAAIRKSDNTLWMWGANSGRLGLGADLANKSSPVQVASDKTWRSIALNQDITIGVTMEGTLWGWGINNTYGQLGQNNLITTSSPVQITAATNWKAVYSGARAFHWFAIDTNNNVWTCGRNTNGQLGVGDIINRSSPVQLATRGWQLLTGAITQTAGILSD